LFLSNAKLGQAEIWSASQQGYHLPPQKFQRNPHHHFGFMIKTVTTTATGNFVAHCVVLSQFAMPEPVRSAKGK
jgi:hypothetical protein